MSIICKHLTKEFLCVKRLSKVHNPLRSDIENGGDLSPMLFAKYNDKESMKEFCKYYEERVSSVPFDG